VEATGRAVSHDFFGSADRRKSEFAGGASDGAPFNEALARLFHAASEAGAPPPHLRAMLATDRWLPIPVPESAVCAAATARTRAYAASPDGRRATGSRKKKRVLPVVAADARNSVAYRVARPDAPADSGADAVVASEVLGQFPDTTRFVVLRFGDDYYGFNRDQCQALLAHFRAIAEIRAAAQQEQRDLLLLAGAGTLDEFLGMQVRVDKALKARSTGDGDVLMLQTLGFSSNRSDTVDMSLRELIQCIATRQDFHGVRFNGTFSDEAAFEFGPNFAAWCLRGDDPRHAGPCPAHPIRDIEFGIYLTRRFARVDAQQKAMIEIRLAHARALLAAIEPGQATLPRSAVISLKGALALRRYPHVAERQWLTAFIARAERALRTRWRIGVF
jgi:hypothetical protein